MSNNSVNKIDGWTATADALKKFANAVKGLVMYLLITGSGVYYAYVNRTEILDNIIRTEIHEDVIKETAHSKHKHILTLENKIDSLEVLIVRYRGRTHKALNKANQITLKLQNLEPRLDAIEKQIKFNTYNHNNIAIAVFDLMRKDEDCTKVRYTRNKVDRYILFNDWYGAETVQPIIASSGCGVSLVPFDRSKIKL